MANTPMRHFRMSDEEWVLIIESAEREGLTASEWIRRMLLLAWAKA